MANGLGHLILIIKAILTRIIFATHGFVAIWRVTTMKNDPYYWYLCASILALGFEGVFTLTIKENQEWKWFCPSVFLYLCSIVPAIWLIEVDKFDRKLALKNQAELNLTIAVKAANSSFELPGIDTFGVELKIPVELDGETWAMVIEQLLMLILIIGRWMLPKGELTRDQLSQLLLVYIGTAADIIEFFDTFKDDKISSQRVLCLLILSIWSWSLLQFTFVLTATKARRTRITADIDKPKPKLVNGIYKVKEVCCSIDVWGILINIILQDAPFLIFRALLIFYYKIINYMNIFFTSKNTLVIILQFYRLYIVQQEKNKEISKLTKINKAVADRLAKSSMSMEQAAIHGSNSKVKTTSNSRSSVNSKRASAGSKANAKPSNQNKSQPKRHKSKESVVVMDSQNKRILEAARREKEKNVGRKSSPPCHDTTTNLLDDMEAFNKTICEDDLEMGMSASVEESVLSGTNDQDSQEVRLDDVTLINERGIGNREIYKISGSERFSSEASSDIGQAPSLQYSSSSRDSGNSSRQGAKVNGGSNARRALVSRSGVKREYEDISDANGLASDIANENERIFQRRAAIGAVFSIFIVLFILCMVAIYGGINPKGLVLRETFKIANSTKPKTTTTTASTITSGKPIITTAEPASSSTIRTSTIQESTITSLLLNETEDSFNNHSISLQFYQF